MEHATAPISPSSLNSSPPTLKRPSSSMSDEDSTTEPTSKRRRLEQMTPPPDGPSFYHISDVPSFDDNPQTLFRRSCALALQHVGFDAATKEALTAMCSQVEAYMEHFLSNITSSMLNARRPEPIPLDFEYALSKFDIPLTSIRPHLVTPIATEKVKTGFRPLPIEEPTKKNEVTLTKLLGQELNGESDKREKSYIPKKFIPFPSKHTYMWTEKESMRETDPRKIREEAAKSARYAEEALRRLVKFGKAGKEKDVKIAASRDPRSKERHELWEKAMEDLMAGKTHAGAADEDQSMIVNAQSQYFRKPVPKKSVGSVSAEVRLEA